MALQVADPGIAITVNTPTQQILGKIAWSDAQDSGLASGKCIVEVTPGSTSALTVELFDSFNTSSLGSTSVPAGAAVAAIVVFNITNPTADTSIILRATRAAAGGVDPIVAGARLEF